MSDAPDSAQPAAGRAARSKSRARESRRQDTTAGAVGKLSPVLDDQTSAALTLYNTYLVADREQQAHERALKKAEKAKDEAAAAVRKLNDRKASAAETAEAETRYREAAEAFQRLRGGAPAPDTEDADDEDADEESAGVEAPVGDDDLAGDEPAGVTGQ